MFGYYMEEVMMAKNANVAVRSHSQEREWLLRLGEGNIFEGVQNLIRQEKGESKGKNNSFLKRGRMKASKKRGA
jgi:hypothetical protein